MLASLLVCFEHHETMQCLAGKVAGAKWEGSKTTFDDGLSHDDGKIPDITAQMEDGETAADLKLCSHPTGAAASQQQPRMKWKKMAMAELQKVSRHLLHVSSMNVCSLLLLTLSCAGGLDGWPDAQ